MNTDLDIKVKAGCVGFLIDEVERIRRVNEIQGVQLSVMNNFFSLVNRIDGKPSVGYEEDRVWQAKKEFQEAVRKAEDLQPQSTPEPN